MKIYKYIGVTMMAAGMLTASSCSDFSDYNEVQPDALASGNQTLWENIKQNPQLSDFAALVQKAGFDDELSESQYYTVWAPQNGTFDKAYYEQLDQQQLLKLFVYNHIASYGHNATGTLNERIKMLNDKKHDFVGQAAYTFDGVTVAQANLPSNNGVMHILDGAVGYYPNLYDFITDATLSAGKEIDSLRNYFLNYELTYLDEDLSVPGPVVDGLPTYIDSVLVTENSLNRTLNTKLDSEDSTYTFIMPTNDVWVKNYDRISSCYNYITTTSAQQFVTNRGTTEISNTPLTTSVDAAYLKDSLAKRAIVRNLVFSNNDSYNQWVEGSPVPGYGTDTLRTTTRNKLSNPAAILAQTKERIQMSNGYARIVDSLAHYSWETYAPELDIAATQNRARVYTGTSRNATVRFVDSDQESYSYVIAEPTTSNGKPELDFYLPNVLSTTYDIYCVFSPAYDATSADYKRLPNRVNFQLNYCDANGRLQNYDFLDASEENIQKFYDYVNPIRDSVKAANPTLSPALVNVQVEVLDNTLNRNTIRGYSNDPTKVDTVYVGQFTFPVSYGGLSNGDDHICPNIKITQPMQPVNMTLMAGFSRDLRIAAIVLKPVDMEAIEEPNKQRK